MDKKTMKVVTQLKSRIAEKYPIRDLRVFGSSARGDRGNSSDIDVLVCLPELNRTIEEAIFDIAYDLELEHDCVIDVIAVCEPDIKGRLASAPIFQKAIEEGIPV